MIVSRDKPSRKMEEEQIENNIPFDILKDAKDKPLQLAEKEREILALHDKLEKNRLEISFLRALESTKGDFENATEEDVRVAQEELLQAKARYSLRNSIFESVLIANPILKAVHSRSSATPIERDLEPLIKARDEASFALADVTSRTLSAREKLTRLESEHIQQARKNAELAATLLSLVEEAKTQHKDIPDDHVREELVELEAAVKASRQRWRIMKGTVSGVIAGSGVDWASDETLRELVLDDED